MVKVLPLHTMKAHEVVNARVHIFVAIALGRGRVASPASAVFTLGIAPVSFHRSLSGMKKE